MFTGRVVELTLTTSYPSLAQILNLVLSMTNGQSGSVDYHYCLPLVIRSRHTVNLYSLSLIIRSGHTVNLYSLPLIVRSRHTVNLYSLPLIISSGHTVELYSLPLIISSGHTVNLYRVSVLFAFATLKTVLQASSCFRVFCPPVHRDICEPDILQLVGAISLNIHLWHTWGQR